MQQLVLDHAQHAQVTPPHPLDPLPKLLALAWPTIMEMPKPAHVRNVPTVAAFFPKHQQLQLSLLIANAQ